MREIKFRIRDRSGRIVGYEKWYNGSYNKDEKYWTAYPCWLYSKDGAEWVPALRPTIFTDFGGRDSFTGLLDKNGTEIYEGDIVEFQWTKKTLIPRCHVYWWSFSCQFKLTGVHMDEDDWDGTKMEVIGNIYENPELLKENGHD